MGWIFWFEEFDIVGAFFFQNPCAEGTLPLDVFVPFGMAGFYELELEGFEVNVGSVLVQKAIVSGVKTKSLGIVVAFFLLTSIEGSRGDMGDTPPVTI